jgi:hypothetical protein
METQEVDTALAAANLALTGSRRRETNSFASIELRATEKNVSGQWDLVVAAGVGFLTVIAVVVAWLY